jgi:hypothetical protein
MKKREKSSELKAMSFKYQKEINFPVVSVLSSPKDFHIFQHDKSSENVNLFIATIYQYFIVKSRRA